MIEIISGIAMIVIMEGEVILPSSVLDREEVEEIGHEHEIEKLYEGWLLEDRRELMEPSDELSGCKFEEGDGGQGD